MSETRKAIATSALQRRQSNNWFLSWDDDSRATGKSLLLQVKLQNISYRDLLSESVNTFCEMFRRTSGHGEWQRLGQTGLIHDESNPEYAEGFRIYYNFDSNLSEDLLRVVCYHRRETPRLVDEVGSATISVRELVRTFGTRVQVELMAQKKGRAIGSVWFLGEGLPNESPRGGRVQLRFALQLALARRGEQRLVAGVGARVFFTLQRERGDATWSVVYRSETARGPSGLQSLGRRHVPAVRFREMAVRRGELQVGMSGARRIRFAFFQKGRNSEQHVMLGETLTTVDELVNEFVQDSSLDVRLNGEVVGEFAGVGRIDDGDDCRFDVEINYFEKMVMALPLERKRSKR